jgi:2-C-methyl-D-erythritol 4-phosphate cytidylyltransferase/2-C-methyl-D-erythritol 2,4-cyclodiphosphate synthase
MARSNVTGIVVAAGRAERFGGSVPKQFLEVDGVACVDRAVRALTSHPGIRDAVVVLHPDQVSGERGERLARLGGVRGVVAGGQTRADSVRQGLAAVGDASHVLVHDAARPLVGKTVIGAVLAATLEHGAAVPAIAIPDTVKEVSDADRVVRTLDRDRLRLAQTPQGARTDWLARALDDARGRGEDVTDEAAALERAGHRVAVVPGDPANMKITTQTDLRHARALLGGDGSILRVGTGFDIHRFGEGRRLVLGGVEFPGETGLDGHSDADVVLHAVMDALLGAVALGDIGEHFPPDDERFRDVASTDLAREVAGMLSSRGFAIVNVDVMVLAERPRIRDRVDSMRRAMAEALGIEAGRVGVKATTLERLGSLGRAEGIASQAVALVRGATDG